MKNFLKNFLLTFAFGLFLVSFKALADDVVPPSVDDFAALLASIGGLKGASFLAIAAFAVQAIMLLIRTKLGEMAGKYRLLIVYVLSVGASILALRLAGVDLGAALVHGNTLAALQVMLNQAIKQFFVKED